MKRSLVNTINSMKFYQGYQTASSTTAQTDDRPHDASTIYVTSITTNFMCANMGKKYICNPFF